MQCPLGEEFHVQFVSALPLETIPTCLSNLTRVLASSPTQTIYDLGVDLYYVNDLTEYVCLVASDFMGKHAPVARNTAIIPLISALKFLESPSSSHPLKVSKLGARMKKAYLESIKWCLIAITDTLDGDSAGAYAQALKHSVLVVVLHGYQILVSNHEYWSNVHDSLIDLPVAMLEKMNRFSIHRSVGKGIVKGVEEVLKEGIDVPRELGMRDHWVKLQELAESDSTRPLTSATVIDQEYFGAVIEQDSVLLKDELKDALSAYLFANPELLPTFERLTVELKYDQTPPSINIRRRNESDHTCIGGEGAIMRPTLKTVSFLLLFLIVFTIHTTDAAPTPAPNSKKIQRLGPPGGERNPDWVLGFYGEDEYLDGDDNKVFGEFSDDHGLLPVHSLNANMYHVLEKNLNHLVVGDVLYRHMGAYNKGIYHLLEDYEVKGVKHGKDTLIIKVIGGLRNPKSIVDNKVWGEVKALKDVGLYVDSGMANVDNGKYPVIVMKLVEGVMIKDTTEYINANLDLKLKWLEEAKPLVEEEVVNIAVEKGILQTDFHPDNYLVGGKKTPGGLALAIPITEARLVDWGYPGVFKVKKDVTKEEVVSSVVIMCPFL
ncbi:hypothetical protein EV368DRAFT_88591 [Lentinula lateritia]|nr:hypothetical protein EV368DRAFT_88591 [Lentinula lateritia]